MTSGLPESAEAVQAEELTNALLEFLGTVEAAEPTPALPTDSSDFLRTALRVDLEDCLQRLAAVVQRNAIAEIEAALPVFAEECLLLGEALGCPWLGEVASLTRSAHEQQRLNAKELATLVMGEVHQLRSQYLGQGVPLEQLTPSEKLKQLVPQAAAVPAPEVTAPAPLAQEEENQNKAIAPELNLRIPVSRLDQMSNLVSELLISHERLLITENQLRLANLNLKQRSQQLKPLREQVQSLYDRLSVADGDILPGLSTSNSEFDSLQFDRYTDVHTTLQQFQELMVQVQEIREDVDLVWRDFQELCG
ncbi:MAG: hypothetical protein HC890_08090 [Chloroflexaceae bacterium]|nr:hypothetical protein [Chloroflexaceae bacterium]